MMMIDEEYVDKVIEAVHAWEEGNLDILSDLICEIYGEGYDDGFSHVLLRRDVDYESYFRSE